jgi:hypothetical protein
VGGPGAGYATGTDATGASLGARRTVDTTPDDAAADDGAPDGATPDDGAPDGATSQSSVVACRPVHRLRDLDRGERTWAAALVGALMLAPAIAVAIYLPRWTPSGDPALMGLRALDVATPRTPLLGQPSSSGLYSGTGNIHHPGPVHFYMLALPVRVLGGATGMLVTSALITGACLAGAAWAVFRELGRRAGVVAVLVLAAIAFTTGASSLVGPISSVIAGYPLLLSAVLLWGVACGDVRLLPAAAAAVSFTAQQHLSVTIATLTITAGGTALLGLTAWRERWREDPMMWRGLRRNLAAAGLVSVALWLPVLAQQAFGGEGNLGRMLWFAREGNSTTLGYASAVRQVTNVLGLPPLLGRTNVTGTTFLAEPDALAWVSAGGAAATVGWLTWRWRAAHLANRARLGAMAGVATMAGLLNGAAVPLGFEQQRIAFYHWTWVLTLFVFLILGLAAADLVGRRVPRRPPVVRRALAGLVVVAVAVPSFVNPALDRRTNTLAAANVTVERDVVESLVDDILARRDALGDRPVLLSRNEPLYAGIASAIAFSLVEGGLDVTHPLHRRSYVADAHLVDPDTVDGAVVVIVDDELLGPTPPGGELVAEAEVDVDGDTARLDLEAYRSLVAAAERATVVRLGDRLAEYLDEQAPDDRALADLMLAALDTAPESAFAHPALLDLLLEYPVEEPAFDRDALRRLRNSLDGGLVAGTMRGIRVFVLDRDETLEFASVREIET